MQINKDFRTNSLSRPMRQKQFTGKTQGDSFLVHPKMILLDSLIKINLSPIIFTFWSTHNTRI
jgi:hypothetical protein